MFPDPNRLWPDVFFYDRELRDCTVYAWLLFGEDDAQYIGGDMFVNGAADTLRWLGWPFLEPKPQWA